MLETIQEQKQKLRQDLRTQAAMLPLGYLAMSDENIARRVMALDVWRAAQKVFLYVSVRTEPDTHRLLQAAVEAGKTVCVPRCLGGGMMEARQITGMADLAPAGFGLLEPGPHLPLVAAEDIDLVVAPCVSADETGRRLGNGGGHYDRFLRAVRCPVVCLCRGVLLQKTLPEEPFDMRVDAVVTEDALYTAPGGKAGPQKAPGKA